MFRFYFIISLVINVIILFIFTVMAAHRARIHYVTSTLLFYNDCQITSRAHQLMGYLRLSSGSKPCTQCDNPCIPVLQSEWITVSAVSTPQSHKEGLHHAHY